jgi:hypothetical protein
VHKPPSKNLTILLAYPMVWTSAKDWQQKLITWDVNEKWFPVVNESVKTGVYKPALQPK